MYVGVGTTNRKMARFMGLKDIFIIGILFTE